MGIGKHLLGLGIFTRFEQAVGLGVGLDPKEADSSLLKGGSS
jgi:hypothetical protein